jgi:hypothetical protein
MQHGNKPPYDGDVYAAAGRVLTALENLVIATRYKDVLPA